MPRVARGRTTSAIVVAARKNRIESTPAERVLWQALRNQQLGGMKFRKQHPVGNYVIDFFCVDEMLAIEVDGSIHDNQEHYDLDQERTQRLNEQDIRVLRFSNMSILEDLPSVLEKIKSFVINTPIRKAGY